MSRRPLIAGNWKMHGLRADGMALVEALLALAGDRAQRFDLMICPPATLIDRIATRLQGSTLQLGAQNCNAAASGAFTGDIAAPMLQDLGVGHVIVGHSERRAGHHETDAMVKAKAEAVLTAGMTPILCVGETHAERQAGQALAVVGRQLEASWPDHAAAAPMVVAYEPIWAIGSGCSMAAR
jgi:triosephosphate isomerase